MSRAFVRLRKPLRLIGLSEKYGAHTSIYDTDKYAVRSIAAVAPDKWESIAGQTKAGGGIDSLYRELNKYDIPAVTLDQFDPSQRGALTTAFAAARRAFTLPAKVDPLDFHQVGEHMNMATSAGWSFPGKKKRDVAADLYQEARFLAHRMKCGGGPFTPWSYQVAPCMAATRGRLSPVDEPSDRLVWVYPAEMLVVEGIYALPLLHGFAAMGCHSPMMSIDNTESRLKDWIFTDSGIYDMIGIDFKRFDKVVPEFIIREAFDIAKENINFDTWKGKAVPPKHAAKWENVWKGIVEYFIETPMAMPDGRMWRKYGGIPSGSYFTSLVGSIANYIIISWLCELQFVQPLRLMVQGDDSGFKALPGRFSLTRAVEDAAKLGMTIDPKECIVTREGREMKLLGYTYPALRRYKPTETILEGLAFPEREAWNRADSYARMVGHFVAGGMNDQTFCQIMQHFIRTNTIPEGPIELTEDIKRQMAFRGGSSIKTVRTPGDFWAYTMLYA